MLGLVGWLICPHAEQIEVEVTHFGKWLRETRIRRGITQAQLAKSIGVTHSYISHLERGSFLTKAGTPARPAETLVDAIAQTLGVSREEARLAANYAPPDQAPKINFGEWLREARLNTGMSQEALAHNIGVTGAYISLLEIGKDLTKQGSPTRPSLHLVDAIAWTLGVSVEEARLAAGYAPPQTVSSALQKLSLMEMFLRLPVHVQEDLSAQIEVLYMKYYSHKIIDSDRAKKTGPQGKSKPSSISRGQPADLERNETPLSRRRRRID